MDAGAEVVPSIKWRVRHEFFVMAAELVDRPGLRSFVARYRARPDVSKIRAFRATAEIDAQQRRATLLEIEEELGSERGGLTAIAAVAGLTLFGAAIAIDVATESPPPNATYAAIRPKFGTPGIKLKGQFDFL